jgi:DHA1 family tetracycline resistance protein-like MFS transporter
VKIFGDQGTVILGFISAIIAGLGYGVTGSLAVIFVLMVVHGPEGFINPLLTARMSKRVPENAQGELQGGISAITNIAMLAGTVFYAQVFGYFMSPAAPFQSPNVAYYVTGAGMALTFGLFLWVSARDREGTGAP